jgi:hypothetical protein
VGLVALAVAAGIAVAGNGRTNDKTFEYAIGLWGDLPYSAVQADPGVPNLIADMNASKLEFTVHDGDLKAGNGVTGNPPSVNCDNALYQTALGWFNSLEGPAMFTPGDNDWTDCDRPSNGGFDSLERLDHERQLFFSTPYSLGTKPMKQEVQSGPSEPKCLSASPPGTTDCVENRRWNVKGVTYATVNVQGSCNNLCDTKPSAPEEAARNTADIKWLDETFAEAKHDGSAAVMIVMQADPGFDQTDGTRAPLRDLKTLAETDANPDGFQSFLVALRNDTIDFEQPVVLVYGDSHYFRIDKPLLDNVGPQARELHARRDLRRQRRERPERRALGEGARRPVEPRRLRLPAADRAGEPGRGPDADLLATPRRGHRGLPGASPPTRPAIAAVRASTPRAAAAAPRRAGRGTPAAGSGDMRRAPPLLRARRAKLLRGPRPCRRTSAGRVRRRARTPRARRTHESGRDPGARAGRTGGARDRLPRRSRAGRRRNQLDSGVRRS